LQPSAVQYWADTRVWGFGGCGGTTILSLSWAGRSGSLAERLARGEALSNGPDNVRFGGSPAHSTVKTATWARPPEPCRRSSAREPGDHLFEFRKTQTPRAVAGSIAAKNLNPPSSAKPAGLVGPLQPPTSGLTSYRNSRVSDLPIQGASPLAVSLSKRPFSTSVLRYCFLQCKVVFWAGSDASIWRRARLQDNKMA
jgi:hypothetical protein